MRVPTLAAAALLLALPCATPLAAQGHAHPAAAPERLGTVHFPTSCAPAIAPGFDRAVALLHSFEFGASIRAFQGVLAADSTCAMAHWGIALSRWANPMSLSNRAPAALAEGRRAALEAARVGRAATERERGYIAAVGQLYDGYESRDQRTRVLAYERAMAELAAQHPADTEARIFHAIALVASALPTDKTYAHQLRAGEILESLVPSQPDHPGLTHYIIHSYDVPALAARATAAAERYAHIAPSAAHALHMPSHTFTRVGMWREAVATNLRSMEAAVRDASPAEALHAADYAVYANLQMRRDSAARAVIAELPSIVARFDPDALTGAAPGSAGIFALAAIPARYALERGAWAEAEALPARTTAVPYADALTHFARGLGAARRGNADGARPALDSLAAIQGRLAARGEAYWAEQVAIQRLGVDAWVRLAAGQGDSALARMREAAAREDATEKAAVTPGPLAPARELLGDMLLSLGQPAAALAEYRAALLREPNRYLSLAGAARAAAAVGDAAAEAQYAAQIARLTGGAAR